MGRYVRKDFSSYFTSTSTEKNIIWRWVIRAVNMHACLWMVEANTNYAELLACIFQLSSLLFYNLKLDDINIVFQSKVNH
jgi:hypothetical protein